MRGSLSRLLGAAPRSTHAPVAGWRRLAFDRLEDRRLLTAGSLDPTFGTGGIASASFPYEQTSQDSEPTVLAESDGGFIIGRLTNAPTASSQSSNYALTRYSANGSVDTSFGADGTVYIPAAELDVDAIASGPSGQIVVVGSFGVSATSSDIGVQWYSAAGVLENSAATPIGYQVWSISVGVESSGQVVVATQVTTSTTPSSFEPVLVRFDADGPLDASFGIDGIAAAPSGFYMPPTDGPPVFMPGGQIVVGGTVLNNTGPQGSSSFALAMFDADGSLDTGFGTDGLVTTTVDGTSGITALAVAPNGQIVAGGVAQDSDGSSLIALARYDTNGALDATFGVGGIAVSEANANPYYVSSLLIQTNGSILAVGYQATSPTSYTYDVVIASFDPDGGLNTAFGQSGISQSSTTDGPLLNTIVSAAMLPDGDILIGGEAVNGATALFEYTSSGALDPTFAGTGFESVNLATVMQPGNVSTLGEAIQPDGKIVALGTAEQGTDSPNALVVSRFDTNGSLDTSFGTGGSSTTTWGNGFTPAGVAIAPNGQIVVAGTLDEYGCQWFAIVRLNANGTVDQTFGIQGMLIQAFGGYDNEATGVAVDSQGRIVVTGTAIPSGGSEPYDVAVRYDANGQLDTSFAGTGIFFDNDLAADSPYAWDQNPQVAIQADGKILLAGDGLIRLDTDGSLDLTFGPGGVIPADTPAIPGPISQMVTEPDGKIVIDGTAETNVVGTNVTPGGGYFEQFNADGSVDASFDAGVPLAATAGVTSTGLAAESNGLIAVASSSIDVSGNAQNGLQVLNPDGTVDTSFESQFATSSTPWNAVAFDASGNIVAAGGGPTLEIARFVAPPAPTTVPSLSLPTTLSLYASATSTLTVEWASATSFAVLLDGQQFDYSTSQYDAVDIIGAQGSTVVVSASVGSPTTSLATQSSTISTTNLTVEANNVTTLYVYGTEQEAAMLYGSENGANTVVNASDYAELQSEGDTILAVGFGQTYATSGSLAGGTPGSVAYFYAAAGSTYVAATESSYITSNGQFEAANDFYTTLAFGPSSGSAQAWLYGGMIFCASSAYAYTSAVGGFNEAIGFQSVTGVSTGMLNYAYLTDTAGGATFTSTSTTSSLVGPGHSFQAIGAMNIVATGTNSDTATVMSSGPAAPVQQGNGVYAESPGGTIQLDSFGEDDVHSTAYGQTAFAQFGPNVSSHS